MKITLTTERGETVSFDLQPGENAWIEVDGADVPTNSSLYLNNDRDALCLGHYDDNLSWWDYANPLPLIRNA